MATLFMIGKFLLSLSILIILHECGHFFPAKWFNTRVEKFYLFFHPWFSIWKKKIGETTYGLGWLPLGGYVKISGMIDESMDREQMKQPAQPWEFRSKPAWQRLIIMLGGVIVNFILGILIFSMILFTWGESYIANKDATNGIMVYEMGEAMGLQHGDRILSVGDFDIEIFGPSEVMRHIVVEGERNITVMRDGQEQTVTFSDEVAKELSAFSNKDRGIFSLRMPAAIGVVAEGSAAEKAGLQAKDQITMFDSIPVTFYDEFQAAIKGKKSREIAFSVDRAGQKVDLVATLDTSGILGVYPYIPKDYIKKSERNYSLGQAFVGGWHKSWNFLGDQIKTFGQLFRGKMDFRESMGGPIAIASMFKDEVNPLSWNWPQFWTLTASLSLILAFMNLLPIPALDGGHVMFLLYEMITGRKPSQKVLEYATLFGFAILLTFMVFVFGNDIMRIWNG